MVNKIDIMRGGDGGDGAEAVIDFVRTTVRDLLIEQLHADADATPGTASVSDVPLFPVSAKEAFRAKAAGDADRVRYQGERGGVRGVQ